MRCTAAGIKPGMIRGYGGKAVDRYNADVQEAVIDEAGSTIALVTDALRVQILASFKALNFNFTG